MRETAGALQLCGLVAEHLHSAASGDVTRGLGTGFEWTPLAQYWEADFKVMQQFCFNG